MIRNYSSVKYISSVINNNERKARANQIKKLLSSEYLRFCLDKGE